MEFQDAKSQSAAERKMARLNNAYTILQGKMDTVFSELEKGRRPNHENSQRAIDMILVIWDLIKWLKEPPEVTKSPIQIVVDEWLDHQVRAHRLDPALLKENIVQFKYRCREWHQSSSHAEATFKAPLDLLDILRERDLALDDLLMEYKPGDLEMEMEVDAEEMTLIDQVRELV